MIDTLRRIDRAWARGEGGLLVLVLILMVFVAGFQASVRNLTRFEVQWANEMLTNLDWADSLLRKGTLWLSFIGASLATHKGQHINMDVFLRIAPPKPKYVMLAISGFIAGIICFGLTYSFSEAVYLNLTERPLEYEMLSPEGESMHVCDATDAQIDVLEGLERPSSFCLLRTALSAISIPAETPGAAFQLIVPIMLFVMSLRLIANGIENVAVVLGGAETIARAQHEEELRILAQQASVYPGPLDGDEDKKT